jgi:hypothetical protein
MAFSHTQPPPGFGDPSIAYTQAGSSRQPNWFLVLFSLPFIGTGLHMLWLGLVGLLGEDPGNDDVMRLVAGFIFAGAGGFTLFAALREARDKQRLEELMAQHPSEPWRWRADWSSGRLPCSNHTAALTLGAFALVWNACCIPLLWGVASDDLPFVWLFVIVGAGMAVGASVLAWRWLRFGRSVLELATLPGRLGDRLRGTVLLRGELLPPKGFRAVLSCVRYTSGRNGGEQILWQEEGGVATETATATSQGTAVPIDFPLPEDGSPSRLPGRCNGILWRMELTADRPGVDFHAAFEVPVFEQGDALVVTGPSSADQRSFAQPTPPRALIQQITTPQPTFGVTAEGERATDLGPVLRPEASMRLGRAHFTRDSPIRVLWRGARGVEIRFPAARNKGYAAIITAAALLWSFFAALAWFAAPLFFGLLLVGAWFLLIYSSLHLWLQTRRAVAQVSGLSVRTSILGISWTRHIPASSISKIEPAITGQLGKRPLYDLKIHRSSGRAITAADGIRSKREAEWLCTALRKGLRGESNAPARRDSAELQAV